MVALYLSVNNETVGHAENDGKPEDVQSLERQEKDVVRVIHGVQAHNEMGLVCHGADGSTNEQLAQ